MKKLFVIAFAIIAFAACNKKTEEHNEEPTTQTTEAETTAAPEEMPADTEVVYACPMHPEVTGKKGDKCSKCEMDLVAQE